MSRAVGTLALIGGGEWRDGCRELDTALLATVDAKEVFVLPTAAAFEHPTRVVERATAYFEGLGAKVRPLMVLRRAEADDAKLAEAVRKARVVYVADGSPLHLRSVLKGSALWESMLAAYHAGGVLAASGAGATLVCDPMVDPRGGAYTVGLGVVTDLAVFPYHGTAADHLRERSIDLLPRGRGSWASTRRPRSCATPPAPGASWAWGPSPCTRAAPSRRMRPERRSPDSPEVRSTGVRSTSRPSPAR